MLKYEDDFEITDNFESIKRRWKKVLLKTLLIREKKNSFKLTVSG